MVLLIIIFTSAGVNSLLMPASAKGMLTYYSRSVGEEAIFYNPAIFNAQQDFGLLLFYSNIYVSMKNLNLALTRRIGDFAWGISIMNFDYGEIEARPEYPTEKPTGFYTASDFSIGLCGSKNISQNGRLGLKVKYIYENIYIYSGGTMGFDISLAYIKQAYGMSAGATNIGGTIKLAQETVNLPAKLSLGYYRNIKKFTFSCDLHYLINTAALESSIAGEYVLNEKFELGMAVNYRDLFYPGFYLGLNHRSISIKYGAGIYPYNLGFINSIGISFLF